MQLVPLLCVLIISTRNIFGSILRPFYLLSISLPNLTEESSSLSTEMNITNIIEKLGVGTGTDSEDEIITAEMKQLSKEIIDEVPKIETALKNFMSILLAQSATGNTQAHRDQEDNFVPLTSDSVLRSVRLIIKKINSWMLPDIVQWGFSNPQSEAEAALKRLDTLTRYKVLSSLHGLAIQKGAKPAKLFGLKYFLWSHVWPSLRDSILSDYSSASSPEVLPDEQCLRYILDKFEQSLSSGS